MAVIPKTENGWGSVFNGGITGGANGLEISFDDFVSMWIWMKDNPTLPAIVTYTGGNFDRTGFPIVAPNADFSNSAVFRVTGLKNKTIRASVGQKLIMCNIRFEGSNENIIWENWNQESTLDDLINIISSSVNIWIRHCRLNQNVFNQIDALTDGNIDVGYASNYIAVTDCIIENGDKTMLISFSNDEPDDIGRMKVTIRRCKFLNSKQRKPLVRYGEIGYEYNISDDRDLTVFSKCIGVGKLSRIFAYRSKFLGGSNVIFEDRLLMDGLAIEDAGALKAVECVIASGQGGTSEIRPELVEATWSPLTEPNYTLEDWTVAEAEAWVNQWAGATMHLMDEVETFGLTVTTTTGGTVSQSPSGSSFTAGTSITLTATADSGFVFSRYRNPSTNGTLSTNSVYTFEKSSSSESIQAVFVSDVVIPPNQKRFFARKKQNI
jgi:pectate lyase